jgi:hypothetical protein
VVRLRDERAGLAAEGDALRQALGEAQGTAALLDREVARLQDEQAGLRQALDDAKDEAARLAAAHAAAVAERDAARGALAARPYGRIRLGPRLAGLVRAALCWRLRRRLREDRAIAVIARCGQFDAAYYLERYPDVAAAGADPVIHYVRFGAAEGRRPNRDGTALVPAGGT